MKLGAKMFFCITIFFSIIFLFGGYTLISYFYEISMEREIKAVVEQYQYNKFVVQANLITRGEEWFAGVADGVYDLESMAADMEGISAFFMPDGRELFSEFPRDGGNPVRYSAESFSQQTSGNSPEYARLLSGITRDKVNYQFLKLKNRTYLLAAGLVEQGDTGIYLVTGMDVEGILEQQRQITGKFGLIYGLAIGMGTLLIFGLSAFLTRPIVRLTAATQKIADGDYKERVTAKGEDEVGQLARNFNQMAAAVEEKVQELSENARQKEDFVANFAHELKTPLTSVIGYADRIYQKELPRAEQKKAAWYIWNEGMRLEELSLKLMDLTLLNHRDFPLQEMRADILLQELSADVEYLMEEKGVTLKCSGQPAYIEVEYDLFKTLFLNLIDNSIKAGAKHIQVTGRLADEGIENQKADYLIEVRDDGSGIPKEDIRRITEAFYMVDKSRSRKQHGAGIGLALAEKIAQIHGTSLEFESDGKSGTTVRLCLKCKGVEEDG